MIRPKLISFSSLALLSFTLLCHSASSAARDDDDRHGAPRQHRLMPDDFATLQSQIAEERTPARKAKALETFLQGSGTLPEGFSRTQAQRAFMNKDTPIEEILAGLNIVIRQPIVMNEAMFGALYNDMGREREQRIGRRANPVSGQLILLARFLDRNPDLDPQLGSTPEDLVRLLRPLGINVEGFEDLDRAPTPVLPVVEDAPVEIPPVAMVVARRGINPDHLTLFHWLMELDAQTTIEDKGFTEQGSEGLMSSTQSAGDTIQRYLHLAPFCPFPHPISPDNVTDETLATFDTRLGDQPLARWIRAVRGTNKEIQIFAFPSWWVNDVARRASRYVFISRDRAPGSVANELPQEAWQDLLSQRTMQHLEAQVTLNEMLELRTRLGLRNQEVDQRENYRVDGWDRTPDQRRLLELQDHMTRTLRHENLLRFAEAQDAFWMGLNGTASGAIIDYFASNGQDAITARQQVAENPPEEEEEDEVPAPVVAVAAPVVVNPAPAAHLGFNRAALDAIRERQAKARCRGDLEELRDMRRRNDGMFDWRLREIRAELADLQRTDPIAHRYRVELLRLIDGNLPDWDLGTLAE